MLTFETSHSLSKAAARERVEALLRHWATKYGVQVAWEGDRVGVRGNVMGVALDAKLEISDARVFGQGTDPGLLLRGQARKYIERKLGEYLSPQASLESLANKD
ncbi:MAG: polyhydroxyalkanoic acid system family protein [Myxococcaceae bacterium]